jgi:integrase
LDYQIKDSAYTLKPEQIRKLINASPHFRDRLIIKILAGTGIRREEVSLLQAAGIDWDRCLLKIIGKGQKIRMVPISEEIRNDLRLWLGKRRTGFVFPSRYLNGRGLKLARINKICEQAGNRAGIKNPNPKLKHINPHLFRHSYARIAKDRGMAFDTLQNIMGHANFITTWNLYGTKSLDDIIEDARIMAVI